MLEITNTSIEEYINFGVEFLIQRMIDNNIDNYLYIIEQTDLIYDYTINGVVDKTNLVNNLINIIDNDYDNKIINKRKNTR